MTFNVAKNDHSSQFHAFSPLLCWLVLFFSKVKSTFAKTNQV